MCTCAITQSDLFVADIAEAATSVPLSDLKEVARCSYGGGTGV